MNRQAKSTNAVGNDCLSMFILKKARKPLIPYITHMINCIIREGTFPDCFKISRITPYLKPDKPDKLMSSYRPINNLCVLEKIVEEFIKQHLVSYLEYNNITHDNHHGSRKHHSTMTALAQILNIVYKQQESGKISAILQTDLSAAYDTVDTKTLLLKMEHYGI